MKKVLAVLLSFVMVFSCVSVAFAEDIVITPNDSSIKIIYTNDAHCAYENYDKVATLAKDADLLIDGGDAIEGDFLGTVSKGEYVIDIMNYLGYDVSSMGNHEYNYTVDHLKKLVAKAEFDFVCCNCIDLKTNKLVFEPYKVAKVNGKKIAFVGVDTPLTLTQANPIVFKDDLGNYLYSFCEGGNGQALYSQVQKYVDEAKTEADYVILIAHLGVGEQFSPWTTPEVIANISGVDLVLDGHSHSTYSENYRDKTGKEIPAIQTGTKLENAGEIIIAADGTITAKNIALDTIEADKKTSDYLDTITDKVSALKNKVVAKSLVDLTTLSNGKRAVRNSETNIGDLCADAYKKVLGSDIAFVNGGGIRADINKGAITYGNIISVHPYGNKACLVEVSGQQIKDALEMAYSVMPNENGGFLQVSGITFSVDTTIPSGVVKDDSGSFVKVNGNYRVRDIMIGGKPIELNQTYTLASHNFMLKSAGDGFSMFGTDNVKILKDEVLLDNEVLINYIVDELGGVVGTQYENPQGRINVIVASDSCQLNSTCPLAKYDDLDMTKWYHDGIHYALNEGIMNGVGGNMFNPNGLCTRGMLAAMLYRVAGNPDVEMTTVFTDLLTTDYFAKSVSWAYANGVVTGVEPHTFGGSLNITREQFATMLYNYAKLCKIDTDKASEDVNTLSFIDIFDVSSWANAGIHWCLASGILTGKTAGAELLVDPQGLLTRAEAAAMIQRYCAQ